MATRRRVAPMTKPAPRTRNTRQKQAIMDLLGTTEDFLSAQQVHEKLSEGEVKVSLATVYRVLQAQVDDGVVDILTQEDGEALFRQCTSTGHHHHLVCRSCRATVEIEAPKIERWADHIAEEHGFTDLGHTLEIFGLCPECAQKLS